MNNYQHARDLIPGWGLFSKRAENFCDSWPAFYYTAHGIVVRALEEGDIHYKDFSLMGIGSCVLGYCDPDVWAAVQQANSCGNMCTLNCYEDVQLAELLIELHPWVEQVRYARTGGEAVAMAVRLARAATGRSHVLVCSYSGWHDWYLAANLLQGDGLGDLLMPGLKPNGVPIELKGTVDVFHYNDLRSLEAKIGHSPIAAIVIEPIRHIAPKKGFLEGVRKIADKLRAVLIFDEVTSGFRVYPGGAHMTMGVTPDLCVLGKAMGNGYAVSAVIGKKSIMSAAENTFLSSTFWTERIGPSAAIATIKKFRENNVAQYLCDLGQLVSMSWRTLADMAGIKISIQDELLPLLHFEFEYDNKQAIRTLFIEKMLERGYLATNSLYLSYAHTLEETGIYLRNVGEVFKELADAIKTGTIEAQLKGRIAAGGFGRLN